MNTTRNYKKWSKFFEGDILKVKFENLKFCTQNFRKFGLTPKRQWQPKQLLVVLGKLLELQ
jgi:hypothetical protein